jgi:hypothetical protein
MLHARLSHEAFRAYCRCADPKRYRRLQQLRASEAFRDFDRTRSIFVHVPKTGGVSVCRAIYGPVGAGHIPLAGYQLAFSAREFGAYFKFGFVRNPWDRVYSAYAFLRKGGMDAADRRFAAETLARYPDFESFVERWLDPQNAASWVHFRPQASFLRRQLDHAIGVDFVGRFETLAADFEHVAERLGMAVSLPRANASERRSSYRDVYTPRMREVVAAVYAEDIHTFGYAFD